MHPSFCKTHTEARFCGAKALPVEAHERFPHLAHWGYRHSDTEVANDDLSFGPGVAELI